MTRSLLENRNAMMILSFTALLQRSAKKEFNSRKKNYEDQKNGLMKNAILHANGFVFIRIYSKAKNIIFIFT
jgi:hypothetical protein